MLSIQTHTYKIRTQFYKTSINILLAVILQLWASEFVTFCNSIFLITKQSNLSQKSHFYVILRTFDFYRIDPLRKKENVDFFRIFVLSIVFLTKVFFSLMLIWLKQGWLSLWTFTIRGNLDHGILSNKTKIEKSTRKIKNVPLEFKRYLFDRINKSNRLIAVKGARGTGKTTLLLQLAYEHKADEVLYIALDDLFFSENTLYGLAENFVKMGGKLLLWDYYLYSYY